MSKEKWVTVLMVMASEFYHRNQRKEDNTVYLAIALKQKLICVSPWTNSFCAAFHKNMWPYYSRTNCQKVRDSYLTTLKASSTGSSDMPPNYTDRLQPMTCYTL